MNSKLWTCYLIYGIFLSIPIARTLHDIVWIYELFHK